MRSEVAGSAGTDSTTVDTSLFNDLLSRFERLLAYASTLQTRLLHYERRRLNMSTLARENSRLRARVGLDEIYIALLEQALESVGVMASAAQTGAGLEATTAARAPDLRKRVGERTLSLAALPRSRVAP